VSVPDVPAAGYARYWLVPIVRAVVALAITVSITFNPDHSAAVGFLAFGLFAAISGLVVIVGAVVAMAPRERSLVIAQGGVSVIAGAVALLAPGAGVPFLLFLVSAWAAVSGFLELFTGIRARRRLGHARDWIFAGGITALFAIVVLVIPADFQQTFTGPDKVERSLTAAVILTGAIGAYAAILGVYLAIAGLSLKWGTQNTSAELAEGNR